VEGTGCDSWVIRRQVDTPATYAVTLLSDWLLSHQSEEVLLDAHLAVAQGVRLDVRYGVDDADWAAETSVLQQIDGLRLTGIVDFDAAKAVAACDGSRPLRSVLSGMGADQSSRSVSTQALRAIRGLISQGFLLPVELLDG
jgi:hypothetical protein